MENRQVLDLTSRWCTETPNPSITYFFLYLCRSLSSPQTKIRLENAFCGSPSYDAPSLSTFRFLKYPSGMTCQKAQFDPSQIIQHFSERPCQPVKWWLGGYWRMRAGHIYTALWEENKSWQVTESRVKLWWQSGKNISEINPYDM